MRSELIESWLERAGVKKYHYADLKLDAIDIEKSRGNQARIDFVISQELVDRYALAMIDGAEFPPLVAYKPTPSARNVVLIDGNNRDAAARLAERTEFGAYVVDDATPEQIRLLTAQANSVLNGQPPSQEERVAGAKHLVAIGYQSKDAAVAMGIPYSLLVREMAAEKFRSRCAVLGIDRKTVDAYGKEPSQRLQAIPSDKVFAVATAVLVDTPRNRITVVVRDLRAAATDEERLLYLEKYAADNPAGRVAPTPSKRGFTSAASMAHINMAGLMKHTAKEVARSCATDLQRETLADDTLMLRQWVRDLEKELDR